MKEKHQRGDRDEPTPAVKRRDLNTRNVTSAPVKYERERRGHLSEINERDSAHVPGER